MTFNKFKGIFIAVALASSTIVNAQPSIYDIKNETTQFNIQQTCYINNVMNVYKEVLESQFNHYELTSLKEKIQKINNNVNDNQSFVCLNSQQELQLAYSISQNLSKYSENNAVSLNLTYEVVARSLSQLFPNVLSNEVLKEEIEKRMFEESIRTKLDNAQLNNKKEIRNKITDLRPAKKEAMNNKM